VSPVSAPNRRMLLIVNPKAQAVAARRTGAVARSLSRGFEVHEVWTRAPGHASELARMAAGTGADVVGVLGGDGTVNEVVNGMASAEDGTAKVPIAVIPGGGANVLVRALGFPNDAVRTAEVLVRTADRPPLSIPLGRIGDRYFVSSCGMGFDAAIVREVERHPKVKRALGDAWFVAVGLGLYAAGYDTNQPHIRVRAGEDPWQYGLYLAILQNLDPFTYLGSRALRVCPDANLGEGLDCFALETMRPARIFPVLFSAFGIGPLTHHRGPEGRYWHDERRFVIESNVPLPVQADGEYLGERQRVEIESIPDALSVYR